MSGRLQKKIKPGQAAALLLIVLAVVQWAWWRGLVYREPTPHVPGTPGPVTGTAELMYLGRADVSVQTYAGDLEPGAADGYGYAARFDRPTGVALDAQGNLYVADTGNHRIRVIAPDGQVTTLAGGEQGSADGPANVARFNAPCGIAVAPNGAVYVADTGNQRIRCIEKGQVRTVADNATDSSKLNFSAKVTTVAGKPDGATAAEAPPLMLPTGIAYVAAAQPYLLVADTGAKCLLKYRLDGTLESAQPVPGPPTAVSGTPQTAVAIPPTGTLMLGPSTRRNVPVGGDAYEASGQTTLALHHPIALCSLSDGWLVADNDFGAVFLVRAGKAEVLAGHCSTSGPSRGMRDDDGAHCSFSIVSGLVTDGRTCVYVADTDNNSIRRINIAAMMGESTNGRPPTILERPPVRRNGWRRRRSQEDSSSDESQRPDF